MQARLGRQLLWLLVLTGMWLLFAFSTELPEVLLGLGSAALSLIGVATLRSLVGPRQPPKLAWLAEALGLIPRFFTDTLVVFGALFEQLVRREPSPGEFRALSYSPGQSDAISAAAADAFVVAANSLTPNTIVLDVDALEGVVLVHQLVPQTHAAAGAHLIRPG